MEKNSNGFVTGVIVTLIAVSLFWGIGKSGKYEGQTSKEWFYDYDQCDSSLTEYKDALNEANDNIDYANSYIEYAQSMAWESYDDMGTALDDLSTVDTVSEPY